MVDAVGLEVADGNKQVVVDRDTPCGKAKELADMIIREMFGCPSSRFRVSTKVYKEQDLLAVEAWMSKLKWQFEKSVWYEDDIVTYCVRK